jgi:O-antigen ligase
MRRIAKILLLIFVFAVPWEFSLELEEPFGPVARIAGILLLLAAALAVAQERKMRTPGPMQWIVLFLFLWFACSYFWTVDQAETQERLRAYFQVMMTVWLVWELVDTPADLRRLARAYVAGSWELALVTIANFASPEAVAAGQVRFVAEGLDPNDTARFLDLAFPFAAMLVECESGWAQRALAIGYFPLALLAMLLTASRGGLVAALAAIAGSAALLVRGRPLRALSGAVILSSITGTVLLVVPSETLDRLETINELFIGSTLNDRVNIWAQGWQAFAGAPWIGSGAGSFTSASGVATLDTAHNTALSIAVNGGMFALSLCLTMLFSRCWHCSGCPQTCVWQWEPHSPCGSSLR